MTEPERFSAAETGALAHLYRGEMYRSTTWRTRLDTTTNWAVVTTGIALSLAYSSPGATPLPLALVGLLVTLFLALEARRYRYFDMWRLRTRVMENHFFVPMLDGAVRNANWAKALSQDYRRPTFHVTFLDAVGRRLRRNYGWIFLIQIAAYLGKLLIHPSTIDSIEDLWERAAIGPVPGELVLLVGALFHVTWLTLAISTRGSRRGAMHGWNKGDGSDDMLDLSTRG